MKKNLYALFLFAAMPIAMVGEHPDEAVFRKIDKEITQHSRVYESLRDAIDIVGHRLTGTDHGAHAEEYAFNLFKEYGFRDVKYQPFELQAWSRDTVILSIAPGNSDNYREVPAVSLAHSPVSVQVKGEIIDVGNGLAEDFEAHGDRIRGKVVLANLQLSNAPGKQNIHRSQKAALAIRYEAAGIIFVNGAPGNVLLTGTASVTGGIIPIPALCISGVSGKELRAWAEAESPMIAEIEMSNFSERTKARNVIATLKGRSPEKIVIGGHLDSWDLATGAIDNGIGSFAVIDIARTFRKLRIKPEKTIEFVLFMGEEQGLLGSRHYVRELKKRNELSQTGYMINLDMTNNPDGIISYGRPETETFFRNIGEAVARLDTSYKNRVSNAAGLHSDHQPFMVNGIPVLGFSGTLPPKALSCYHADCDHFDLVNKAEIEKTVRVASMYLYALASAKTLPAPRLTPTETRDLMIAQGLKEALILGNDWTWDQ
ncbi:MAG: aminopeptidase [Cytophagaceae bacterium SCN 52-12]|nr:MAG: aminopeptidase [Cytophagaceae bacterium SCN 52-12]